MRVCQFRHFGFGVRSATSRSRRQEGDNFLILQAAVVLSNPAVATLHSAVGLQSASGRRRKRASSPPATESAHIKRLRETREAPPGDQPANSATSQLCTPWP